MDESDESVSSESMEWSDLSGSVGSSEEAREREYKEREFSYLKLWPAIREEFKNGSKKEEAFRNVYIKSGRNPPTYSDVHNWMQDYYDGDWDEEIGDFHGDVRSAIIGQYLKFEHATYFSQGWKFSDKEAMLYSRYILIFSDIDHGLSVVDSFSGEQRVLEDPIPSIDSGYFQQPVWIDPTHILAKDESLDPDSLVLLQIELDQSKWNVLDKFAPRIPFDRAIVDTADSTKFAIIHENSDSTFIHQGHVIDDRIVMDGERIEIFARFRYPKIEKNQLYGFQRMQNEEDSGEEWHFEKYTLDSNSARKVSSIKTWFRNSELDDNNYIWSKDRLFVLVYYYGWPKYFTVVAFNSESNSWADTNIVGAALPTSITIDDDDILTVSTLDGDWVDDIQPIYKTVHRFPMRKPEKLRFLAWFTIRRGKMLFDSDLYDKLRLPYTCEFRPFV